MLNIGGTLLEAVEELFLAQLLSRGREWPAADAALVYGESLSAHVNAVRLSLTGQNFHEVPGWALADDGVWRQHVWATQGGTGRVTETIGPRIAYYGFNATISERISYGQHRDAFPTPRPAAEVAVDRRRLFSAVPVVGLTPVFGCRAESTTDQRGDAVQAELDRLVVHAMSVTEGERSEREIWRSHATAVLGSLRRLGLVTAGDLRRWSLQSHGHTLRAGQESDGPVWSCQRR